jgi:hypothetical protein
MTLHGRSARRGRALLLGGALAVAAASGQAHDLITAEAAERYLAEAGARQRIIGSSSRPAQRAQAHYALGRMLDEVRDLLNRDIATHGEVQGLPSEYLVAELKARGTPLATQAGTQRFPANLDHYRAALRLAPDGPVAADAAFRLLQGYFYDSFVDDPLSPRNQTWAQLEAQLQIGERFLARHPAHPDREEAEFIVAVHYLQAARSAPQPAARGRYETRAREALEAFRVRYPQSMRVSAAEVLLETLGGR